MAIYEFECKECGVFEQLVCNQDNLNTAWCPLCGTESQRVPSVVATAKKNERERPFAVSVIRNEPSTDAQFRFFACNGITINGLSMRNRDVGLSFEHSLNVKICNAEFENVKTAIAHNRSDIELKDVNYEFNTERYERTPSPETES